LSSPPPTSAVTIILTGFAGKSALFAAGQSKKILSPIANNKVTFLLNLLTIALLLLLFSPQRHPVQKQGPPLRFVKIECWLTLPGKRLGLPTTGAHVNGFCRTFQLAKITAHAVVRISDIYLLSGCPVNIHGTYFVTPLAGCALLVVDMFNRHTSPLNAG